MEDKFIGHFGVYCGRFNPLHLGHEAVLNEMLRIFGTDRSLVVIGSANTQQSIRHFFSYLDRRGFITTVFPEIRTVPLPDFQTDEEWLVALDDLLRSAGIDPEKAFFFGGCEEDISFFVDNNRKYHVLNRFDGTTPKISATEIRDSLIFERDTLSEFLNPAIKEHIESVFRVKWAAFQKK